MTRLVCVSNRVAMPRRGAAPGGLAVGLLAALKQTGGMWFGWGGDTAEHDSPDVQVQVRDAVTYATVELKKRDFERYYNGYSNATLWPLFHYMASGFQFSGEQYAAYQQINRVMAERLLPLLQKDDIIWVHDYHLIPFARCLRELGVKQPIGFFLHIPFPHIEMLRILPTHAELLRELATYDLTGFQSENDLRSFRAGIEYLWGPKALRPDGTVVIEGRVSRTGVFPIGIDVESIQNAAAEAASGDAARRMIASLQGRKLMIGVDRLDYSKGLLERFNAWQRFLETRPENQGRVTFMQIAPLSRSDVKAYAHIRQSLEQAAGRLNGRFADADWTPIRYLNKNIPHSVLTGYMRAAQVGLVTPVRDGMNLVAKEFVASQDAADPGVLILSPMAGAARELDGALQVNPYDAEGLAAAMQAALSMPLEERRERHAGMMAVLKRNDITAWWQRFVGVLQPGLEMQVRTA